MRLRAREKELSLFFAFHRRERRPRKKKTAAFSSLSPEADVKVPVHHAAPPRRPDRRRVAPQSPLEVSRAVEGGGARVQRGERRRRRRRRGAGGGVEEGGAPLLLLLLLLRQRRLAPLRGGRGEIICCR